METSSIPTPGANDAESKFEANQRLTAFGAVLGAVGLAVQHIMSVTDVHGWPIIAIIFTALAGWIVFGIGVIRNRSLKSTPEGAAFFEFARRDERLLVLRAQAFTWGFFAMLFAQVVFLVVWTVMGHADAGFLIVPVVAPVTIAAGVSGAVLRYQVLSNR